MSQDTHVNLIQLRATSLDKRQALLLTWDQPCRFWSEERLGIEEKEEPSRLATKQDLFL